MLKVCNKAFARRDKLVIHMNKFKHVTPTNIAPLGKRHNNITGNFNLFKYFHFFSRLLLLL